jgi:hypothetical protein
MLLRSLSKIQVDLVELGCEGVHVRISRLTKRFVISKRSCRKSQMDLLSPNPMLPYQSLLLIRRATQPVRLLVLFLHFHNRHSWLFC